jgi:hypothetical protein
MFLEIRKRRVGDVAASGTTSSIALKGSINRPGHHHSPYEYQDSNKPQNCTNNDEDEVLWELGGLQVRRSGLWGYCRRRVIVAARKGRKLAVRSHYVYRSRNMVEEEMLSMQAC